MADVDHYRELADGLETAAKAARACAEEESSENEDQEDAPKSPKNLREAERKAYVTVRAHRRASRQAAATGGTSGQDNSGEPDSDDRVK